MNWKLSTVSALGVAALTVARPAWGQECVECRNVAPPCNQDCFLGDQAKACLIFYEMGCRWCNMIDPCYVPGDSLELEATDLSPAGTYVAARSVVLPDRGVAVHPCTGFIVRYLRADVRGESEDIRVAEHHRMITSSTTAPDVRPEHGLVIL